MHRVAHCSTNEKTEAHGRQMTHPGPPVRFREEPVPGCRSPRPPARGQEGTPGLALSLPFSPPRAVLTHARQDSISQTTQPKPTAINCDPEKKRCPTESFLNMKLVIRRPVDLFPGC